MTEEHAEQEERLQALLAIIREKDQQIDKLEAELDHLKFNTILTLSRQNSDRSASILGTSPDKDQSLFHLEHTFAHTDAPWCGKHAVDPQVASINQKLDLLQ